MIGTGAGQGTECVVNDGKSVITGVKGEEQIIGDGVLLITAEKVNLVVVGSPSFGTVAW